MRNRPAVLTTQLIWDRLLAIVEEQAQTLMRTAFSTVVREAGDLSAGVFDTRGRMLAQAITGTPGHVNAMAAAVPKFLALHPLDSLRPGDVLVTNDPWVGTGHLNDFTVVSPVFHRDRIVGLFASTSHIADVGGRGFGADASDVFEEGLRIPVCHLFREGRRDETLMRLVLANVRDAATAEGDLHSLAACNHAGGEALVGLLETFDVDALDPIGEDILSRSEDAMRAAIAALPTGTWQHAMTIDGYDSPLELRCAVTVGRDDIHVDFAGSASASRFGINVPIAYTEAYASFAVRCLVGNDIPNNAGSLGTISVVAPPDSLLDARHPRAVSARHAVGQMLPDLVFGCLDQALPGQVPAEGASCIWNPVFRSVPGARTSFVTNPIFNGGTGARPGKDGLSTTAFPSGVRTTSTEINEVTAPLIIWRKEYRTDSAGSGALRGGFGQVIEIGHRDDEPFLVAKMFDRVLHPPAGRRGGHAGLSGAVRLDSGIALRGKGLDEVPAGARLILETPGGGGLGAPGARDLAAIERDLDAGLVSPAAAQRDYGFDRSS